MLQLGLGIANQRRKTLVQGDVEQVVQVGEERELAVFGDAGQKGPVDVVGRGGLQHRIEVLEHGHVFGHLLLIFQQVSYGPVVFVDEQNDLLLCRQPHDEFLELFFVEF